MKINHYLKTYQKSMLNLNIKSKMRNPYVNIGDYIYDLRIGKGS